MSKLFFKDTLIQWQIDMGHPGEDWMFTFCENNRDNLIICLGDSWTFGHSLLDRENEIYGKLLANHYDTDFINVGCPGWSNSWILLNGEEILTELAKNNQYKKVYVIITLSENARDILTIKSFDFLQWARQTNLVSSKSYVKDTLDAIQEHWLTQIKKLLSLSDDRFIFFIGQNFVWHDIYDSLASLPNVITSDLNWIEVLADAQNMPRPIRTNLVTGWIFNTLNTINQELNITDLTHFKEYTLPLIEKSIDVNNWLDSSDLNNKKASKHPNAKAHRLWADYIIQHIDKGKS